MALRLVHLSPGLSGFENVENSGTGENNLLIRTLASGISQGTERIVAGGMVPPEIYRQMHVPYMSGDFTFPVAYGYSLVGEVKSGNGEWKGKRVHLMHPHQDFCRVNTEDVTVLPDALDVARATLLSNMETAITGYWDAQINKGENILVAGFGTIGALLACVLRIKTGNPLTVLEKIPERRKIAENMGFQTIAVPDVNGFDIVFDTTGNPELPGSAFSWLKHEGRLVLMSWYGTRKTALALGGDFHIKRLKIIASQVSEIPRRKRVKWDFKKRKKAAISMLQNPLFETLPIEQIPFAEAPAFFEKLRKYRVKLPVYCFIYD